MTDNRRLGRPRLFSRAIEVRCINHAVPVQTRTRFRWLARVHKLNKGEMLKKLIDEAYEAKGRQ